MNPYLPQKSENLRPNSSNSIENATPSSSTSPLAFSTPPPPRGNFHLQLDIDQNFRRRFQHPQLSKFFLIKLQVTTIFDTKIIFQYTDQPLRANTLSLRNSSHSDHNFPSLSQSWNLSYPLNIIFNY